MNYGETLDYIASFSLFGSKLGLERLTELLERMGNPHNALKFIHVAGTNGKGSTTTMLSNILRHAGYRTGLYISPYVLCFRERMQLDGEMISEDELAACATYVRTFVDEMAAKGESPTEFEVETAMAFEWYKRRGCEIVCLEVGLGGRFDATNVIAPPELQVITSISLDHVAILGDTVAKIAYEKAGIIKGGAAVIYPLMDEDAVPVLMEQCARTGSTLIQPNANAVTVLSEGLMGTDFMYGEARLHVSLPGHFQIYNTLTVVEAARQLKNQGWRVTEDDISYGVAHTWFPARMEVLSEQPLAILDGAHNPSGTLALEEMLVALAPRPITVIMGMLADKDYETALASIARHAARFIAVTPPNPRALPASELAKCAAKYCADVCWRDALSRALDLAVDSLPEDGALIMCGSLYLAADLRPIALERLGRVR